MRNTAGENLLPKSKLLPKIEMEDYLFAPLSILEEKNKRRSMVLVRLSIQFWCPHFEKLSVF